MKTKIRKFIIKLCLKFIWKYSCGTDNELLGDARNFYFMSKNFSDYIYGEGLLLYDEWCKKHKRYSQKIKY